MNDIEIKRFSKEDWYAYAGAEKFHTDGSDPFIYTQALSDGKVECTAIADAYGIQIFMCTASEDSDEELCWGKTGAYPDGSPIRREGELRAIAKALQQYSYAPDLSYALDHAKLPEFAGFEIFE